MTTAPAPHSTRYLPEIDGLRALAVVLVLLCHARFSAVAGGYIGVDVFFVISGYVVCRSILDGQQAGTFSLKQFYTRRLKRLAPALLLVMAATLVFCLVYNFPGSNLTLLKSIRAVLLLNANIFLARQTGYFDLQADKHPLLHTWSLSVEEQFYLIVPLLLILVARLRASVKLALVAGLWAAALAWSWSDVSRATPGAYFYLQGRLFELLCGVVLVFALRSFPVTARRAWYDVLLLAGLAVILVCGSRYHASTTMPGINALWPCLGAVLVIVGIEGARYCRGLLNNRVAVFLGKISYVLYLWHWPVIFAFGRLGWHSAGAMTAALGLSLVLAVATHYLVENPLRRARWSPLKTFVLLFLLPVLTVVVMLQVARKTDNFMAWYPARYQQDNAEAGSTVFDRPRAKQCWSQVGVTPAAQCTVGNAASPRKAVLLGDSHAYHLIDFMDQLGQEHGLAIHDMTFTMCAPIENSPARAGDPGFQQHAEECREHGRNTIAWVLSQPEISLVFMSAVWDLYHNTGTGAGVQPTGHGFMPGQINTELALTISKLQAAGKRVVFLDDLPLLPVQLENCVSNRVYLPGHAHDDCSFPRAEADVRYRDIDAILSDLRARFPLTARLHTYDVPCDAQRCHADIAGTGLYAHNDRGHLGAGGSAIYYRAYRKRHPGELEQALSELP